MKDNTIWQLQILLIGLSMIAVGAIAVSRPEFSQGFLGGFILIALVLMSYQLGIRYTELGKA